jgi:hypothetical protein
MYAIFLGVIVYIDYIDRHDLPDNRFPNSTLYYYPDILNTKTDTTVISANNFVAIKNVSKFPFALVFLGSFVISQNGAKSFHKGSPGEEVVNLM